jgi:predicted Zn-dependent peptidase
LQAEPGTSPDSSLDALLTRELPVHPALNVGRLPNGLRYVILPNRAPPNRFEAHLQMHAGSVDEGENEQGIAHLVEHVTFLGSKRREGLLGTGARSNAYTDFHHTVFHVHAPERNGNTGEPMLEQVLDALTEIAFEPDFLPSRIDKERKAVVAEAQMMNTIEYRVDCQLLQYLHWENNLGCRFPIGKMEQVEKWEREQIVSFWRRHYSPANATVYVVGDVDAVEAKELVEKTFGRVPASPEQPSPAAAALDASILASAADEQQEAEQAAAATTAAAAIGGASESEGEESHSAMNGALLMRDATPRPRGMVRPPVDHQWGCGPPLRGPSSAPVSIFRHRLLQLFQVSVFCKLPIRPMTKMEDLR